MTGIGVPDGYAAAAAMEVWRLLVRLTGTSLPRRR
jgi:hypothetical protein